MFVFIFYLLFKIIFDSFLFHYAVKFVCLVMQFLLLLDFLCTDNSVMQLMPTCINNNACSYLFENYSTCNGYNWMAFFDMPGDKVDFSPNHCT